MNNIYLLTGGNLGDRLQNIEDARVHIEKKVGPVIRKSLIYETAAWGITEQPAFLNQVLSITTILKPEELIGELLAIELELGRKRLEKMGPRLIDIDILFYGQQIISLTNLIIPHPRIAVRRFVLTPLAEIAGSFIHPVLNKTIHQLLQECPDELEVKVFQTPAK